MKRALARYRNRPTGPTIARIAVGAIWLAGAAFNVAVTRRMDDPYGWIADGSPVPIYRWFFSDVVGAHPAAWTIAPAAGEAAIGLLTLAGGHRAWLGLAGGTLFSALLFSLLTPYTMMMGPYTLFLLWLLYAHQRQLQLVHGSGESASLAGTSDGTRLAAK